VVVEARRQQQQQHQEDGDTVEPHRCGVPAHHVRTNAAAAAAAAGEAAFAR
jgi:hypothetical protein